MSSPGSSVVRAQREFEGSSLDESQGGFVVGERIAFDEGDVFFEGEFVFGVLGEHALHGVFGVEGLEDLDGDMGVVAALAAGFGDHGLDLFVDVGPAEIGDVLAFLVGEVGEGGLDGGLFYWAFHGLCWGLKVVNSG